MGFDVGFGVLVLIAGSKNDSFQWGLAKVGVSKWQFVMGFRAKNDRCAASPRHLPSDAERYLFNLETETCIIKKRFKRV